MNRFLLVVLIAALAAGCGRKGDPERPEGAYASPDTATPIEQAGDDDPVPDVLGPGTDEEDIDG